MRVLAARRALLLYVGNLPVRRDFPVVARDAATPERREAEETNKTHHGDPPTDLEQFLYRRAHARSDKIVSGVSTVVSRISACFCGCRIRELVPKLLVATRRMSKPRDA